MSIQHKSVPDIRPRIVAMLVRKIMDGLDRETRNSFLSQVAAAISVNADLSNVWPKFATEILQDYMQLFYDMSEKCKKTLKTTIHLHQRKLKGERISRMEWSMVRYDASDCGLLIAYCAASNKPADASSVITVAAQHAGEAAGGMAVVDDYTAADAIIDAVTRAARRDIYKKMADKLIELLQNKIVIRKNEILGDNVPVVYVIEKGKIYAVK